MDNTRLINIYIKIHNKKNITLDDLCYLAQYDPECFRKTCANVVYNIPETKVVMQNAESEQTTKTTMEAKELPQEEFDVLAVLDNLKQMDADEAFYKDIDAKRVKNLLGNLYMELLFPHNDKDTFFSVEKDEKRSLFDKKVWGKSRI